MKFILFISIFYTLYVTVNAWLMGISYNETLAGNHTSHCYSDYFKIGELKKHEEKRIEGQCAVARCLDNRDISVAGCGTARVGPPCHLEPGDLSKPYPDCCFEIKCSGENQSNSIST